jgi:hypothetical protein
VINGSDQAARDCGMRVGIPYLRKSAPSAVKELVAWDPLAEILFEMRNRPAL